MVFSRRSKDVSRTFARQKGSAHTFPRIVNGGGLSGAGGNQAVEFVDGTFVFFVFVLQFGPFLFGFRLLVSGFFNHIGTGGVLTGQLFFSFLQREFFFPVVGAAAAAAAAAALLAVGLWPSSVLRSPRRRWAPSAKRA